MKGRCIVIGGGFGGLSAGALLAQDGWDVRLLEKNPDIGGRARIWRDQGFLFDMGPSWYLMPDVFERFFAELGTSVGEQYELKSLDPYYRVFESPGGGVDITDDMDHNARLFDRYEPEGGRKLLEYLEQARHKYDIAMSEFLYRDYTSILQFLNRRMVVQGTRLNVFSPLDRFVSRFFSDRRARQILEYAMVFLGNSPTNAPALYSIMSHVDLNLGVHYPLGGLGAVVESIASLATAAGARLEASRPVRRILTEGRRAVAVVTDEGEMEADIVVSSCDYPHTEMDLLDEGSRSYSGRYWQKRVYAPSMLNIYLGMNRRIDGLAHHNLYFQENWDTHFDTIFRTPSWPEDPCFYVSCPSKTDSTVAPAGCENVFVLVPVAPGLSDPESWREQYAETVLKHVEEKLGVRLRDSITTRRIFSHRDFSADYNAYRGTALGMAHTLRQTAVFRPGHRSRKVENLFFTGQYTHPGVGVPMTLIASQIARDVIRRHA